MNNKPLVSVIIPNYNHARFLDERIQSVLNQTYQNFEVIILDDKSSDNSVEVIRKYKDNPHISHIVVNDENSGSPFKQWQKGIELAKGEIVWLAESDDSCSPFFLDRLVFIQLKNNSIFTFCRSQHMNEQGHLLSTWHNEISNDFCIEGHQLIEQYLGIYNLVTNASSAIFNKSSALSISKKYMTMKGAGDWLFWLELARLGKVSFCNESLNYFREHTTNTTQKCYKNGVDFFEGKEILSYLKKNQLLSKKTVKYAQRYNIDKILNSNFDSPNVKNELLIIWGYNKAYKIKKFVSKVLCKLESLLWR